MRILLAVFIILFVIKIEPGTHGYWVVWNVGQGQWISWVDTSLCYHFDMGGEKNVLEKVQAHCARKQNYLHLSHWDWDHVSFILRAQKTLRGLCLVKKPPGQLAGVKLKISKSIARCQTSSRVSNFEGVPPKNQNVRTSNELSLIYEWNHMLFPGDSPATMEKRWAHFIRTDLKFLALAHHGSRSSTSLKLLRRFPFLRTAFVSARSKKYGHPHKEVVHRVTKEGIALLRTEEWGNIKLQGAGAPRDVPH